MRILRSTYPISMIAFSVWGTLCSAFAIACLTAAVLQPKPPMTIDKSNGPSKSTMTKSDGGNSKMHTSLKLTISPKRAEVLVGESLEVEVTLTNSGTTPFDVPSPDTPSQFEFILRSVDEEGVIHVLSATAALEARTGESTPPGRYLQACAKALADLWCARFSLVIAAYHKPSTSSLKPHYPPHCVLFSQKKDCGRIGFAVD